MNWYAIAVAGLVICGSFLGTWAANALGAGTPKPKHDRAKRFPVDLDALDQPTGGAGEL